MTLTLVVLGVTVVLLLSDRVRADFVALAAAAVLGVSGVLSPAAAFSGFGSRAAITILAVSILAEGLKAGGVAERAGALLLRASGAREGRLVGVTMLMGAVVSLFMNNIAAGAVLLPGAAVAARRARLAPSRIMMPLAFGTILGGMATLLTTSNLIVSDLLTERGFRGFGLFDFAPIGGALILAGIAYMLFWGRHRLPVTGPEVPDQNDQDRDPLQAVYRLEERIQRARVPAGSPLAGRRLADSGVREQLGLSVTAVRRSGTVHSHPGADFRLAAGDELELMGRYDPGAGPPFGGLLEPVTAPGTGTFAAVREGQLAEAVLPPRSPLQGRTLREVRFGDRFGLTVLAVWRGDRPIRSGLGDLALAMGDALLLQGPRRALQRVRRSDELLILGGADDLPAPARWKTGVAVLLLVSAIVFGARNAQALGAILLLAALAMVPLGLLTMERAHQAIDWRTIFLVAGILPVGLALQQTGAAAAGAEHLVRVLGPQGPVALLAGVFAITVLLTQAVVGPAAAAIMGPVAIDAAVAAGTDPRAMAMAVALACSMAFLTPLGHPVNVLVMGPGGYRFADYRRVGLPMAVVLAVVVLVGLPLLFFRGG